MPRWVVVSVISGARCARTVTSTSAAYPYSINDKPNFNFWDFCAPHHIQNPKITYLDYHVITTYRKAIKVLGIIIHI